MNTEFLRLQAGSRKLNDMRKDVKWGVETLKGMIRQNLQLRDTPGVACILGTVDHFHYILVVQLDEIGVPTIKIEEQDSPVGSDATLDPCSVRLNPALIKLVFDNFDTIIDATRAFVKKLGSIEAEHFESCIANLTCVLEPIPLPAEGADE